MGVFRTLSNIEDFSENILLHKCGLHGVKSVQIRSFFWSLFFHIQSEYGEILRIQSECGKIRTRKHSVFGHFSRSVMFYVSDLNYEIQILGLPKSKCYTHAHVISLVRYTGSVKNVFSMLYHPDFDLTLLWYSALFCKHLEYQKHHTCLYRCYFVYLILIIQN